LDVIEVKRMGDTLNFNVGVLGHVDSGKTSLVKALSTTASTACFDKNPQSAERGITLDLGFSSLVLPEVPPQVKAGGYNVLQVTLVDCPGHASLIKTIIGGAQIIDLMMLVVDATKGMQTQTAECLVIGEIVCKGMLVVLNKVDLLPPNKREAMVEKISKKLRLTFQQTKFPSVVVVPVSARPGGPESGESPQGLESLLSVLTSHAYIPERGRSSSSCLLSVDHCFSIRGQGTVLTATVLQGKVKLGDSLEVPVGGEVKKVKSIQMFKKSVEVAQAGDRAGVCVTQFEPSLLERGLVSSPGAVPRAWALVTSCTRIKFFKGDIQSKAKFHISLGHETVMAKITLFALKCGQAAEFSLSHEYEHLESLEREQGQGTAEAQVFVLLELERCVAVVPGCVVIGSRLDTDINANMCRLAFHGTAVWLATSKDRSLVAKELEGLRVAKLKSREGIVERLQNEQEVIVKDLFKKETNLTLFTGLAVMLSTGEKGYIEGSFGQSGKVKVRLREGLMPDTVARLPTGKKKGDQNSVVGEPVKVILSFKRYIFDSSKKMIQS